MQFFPLFYRFPNGQVGPSWSPVFLDGDAQDKLERSLVFFVATDDGGGNPVGLGTGFIVGVAPDLIVVSAAHVFTDWLDRVSRPIPSVFPEQREADCGRRFNRHRGLLRAIIRPHGSPPLLCEIRSFGAFHDPCNYDVAVMTLSPPQTITPQMLDVAHPVDIDEIELGTIVVAAGYTGPKNWEPPGDRGTALDRFDWKLDVRASVLAGFENDAPGYRNGMYRAQFPAMHGMSGGPVCVFRRDPPGTDFLPAAVGVISRERTMPPGLHEETWIAPIQDTFALHLDLHDQPGTYFCDAVKMGRVISRGTRAGKATAGAEGSQTMVDWGDADPRRCGRTKEPPGGR